MERGVGHVRMNGIRRQLLGRRRGGWLCGAVVLTMLAIALGASARDAERGTGEQIRRTMAELSVARAEILRTDPEAKDIHQRILRLYSKLDRVLGRHREIQELRSKLEALREAMPAGRSADAQQGDPGQ